MDFEIEDLRERFQAGNRPKVWMALIKRLRDEIARKPEFKVKVIETFKQASFEMLIRPLEYNAAACAIGLTNGPWDDETKRMADQLEKTGSILYG